MQLTITLVFAASFGLSAARPVASTPESERGMRRLPGGTYRMQYSRGEFVTVQPFWLDATPVTAKAYAECVKSGNCSAPERGQDCTFGATGKDLHPVNCVDWNQANAFCAAAGKRLPTEEEWEWAARGADLDTVLPWGDDPGGVKLCSFPGAGRSTRLSTCRVGSFPRTDSPQGIKDLVGNVAEWTSSCGTTDCSKRVLRGTSFAEDDLCPPCRGALPPTTRRETYGFRCAKQAGPDPDLRVAKMAPLPGGSFTTRDAQRAVNVQPFLMDVTEVTVGAYRACVEARKCSAPGDGPSCNFGKPERLKHPVNCVDWNQASIYCESVGKRLPTAEEWEWAARGATRGTIYPWGNQPPKTQVCWSDLNDHRHPPRLHTCAVASFPAGDSPQGIKDLAGNVWEWTSTAFDDGGRVVRGGSWDEVGWFLAAGNGGCQPESARVRSGGFRCVKAP